MHRKICYYLNEIDDIVKGKYQHPITVEIDPSNLCQCNCSFCMYKDYREDEKVNLNFDKFVSLIIDLKNTGVKSITFTGGGEPMMNPKFINMIEVAHKLGFELGLITNGLELHKLTNLQISYFTFIRISVDAGSNEIYKKVKGIDKFDIIVRNIKKIYKEIKYYCFKTTLGISYVVCEDNKDDIENCKIFLNSYVDYIQVKPEVHITEIMENIEDNVVSITNRYKPDSMLPCHIAGLIGIVGANGSVYYCCQKRGDQKYNIGNIYNDDFCTIWNNRLNIKPDVDSCDPCRYMNYAKEYEKVKGLDYLRHRSFL